MQGVGPYVVFVDANVCFSRTLRDWLGMLYTTPENPSFVVHWTEDVLAELIYHLRKTHPDWPGSRITTVRGRLSETFEAGRVADFAIDTTYRGNDPGDAHVHAAAVACGADVLVTCNVGDFVWDESLRGLARGRPAVVAPMAGQGCFASPGPVDEVQREACRAFGSRWATRSPWIAGATIRRLHTLEAGIHLVQRPSETVGGDGRP